MSNRVNGLWAVNSDGVFMFFNSVDSPSVWRFGMSDNVESWRMVPGVVNAQAVRGVAAVYRAEGGVWLDPNGVDYAQAVREIGDVPSIVERGGLIASDDCGDYSAHGLSLPDVDRERGWVLSWEHGGMVVSRDVSFLTPMEQDHLEMCETYDDLPVVEPVAPVVQSVEVVEPEPVTAEIPEIPPQTEPHEVVGTSSAIIVRKVVIPGGASVKELADVFGAYVHKPRGFRDSTGRRVAYVAFDGTGGVIAYRDYYTDVDTRLEEQIADYLASHNLKLAA